MPLTVRPPELILEALPPVQALIESQAERAYVRSANSSTAALARLPVCVPRKDSSSSQDSAQASEHERGEPRCEPILSREQPLFVLPDARGGIEAEVDLD